MLENGFALAKINILSKLQTCKSSFFRHSRNICKISKYIFSLNVIFIFQAVIYKVAKGGVLIKLTTADLTSLVIFVFIKLFYSLRDDFWLKYISYRNVAH